MAIETLSWQGGLDGHVRMIEQTLLPAAGNGPGGSEVLEVRDIGAMFDGIRRLAVRGAPAIGVAAAYGLMLGIQDGSGDAPDAFMARLRKQADYLAGSRPTAVNLFWALERMVARAERARAAGEDTPTMLATLLTEAHDICKGDQDTCMRMGDIGAELIADGATILTHCNAGALATAGIGTALAPIYRAAASGKRVSVYADETRPLLQGARLTAWELMQEGIDVTLITDSMAARVMYEGKIDAVFVGSDRIARNGDVCNKIGTYSVALAAKEHGVPFYVVAPLSTFDAKLDSGDLIPIEERDPREITEGFGRRTAPEGVKVYNPAFDVTPARLVTGIITEVGLIEQPTMEKVEAALALGAAQAS
ncbi:MAG: methylthioribose-1-phosphate isomerase [Chlamydiales bacterium]|jgi:methylthioribose-1-phosphate isomerase